MPPTSPVPPRGSGPAVRLKPPQGIFKTSPAPPPVRRKGGIEWIPWGDLNGGQKLGRLLALAVFVVAILIVARGVMRKMRPATSETVQAPALEISASDIALTSNDRRDGIVSLCKVFQVYGVPNSDDTATNAAKNAAQLFKLAKQTPERSLFILNAVAHEFSSGKLTGADCATAGEPLPAATDTSGGAGDAPATP
jgi:hypothetical protein